MKFAVFFIVMVCTNMYVCKAQDRSSNFWHKPAANIGAANKGDTAYSPNTVIEDWDVDSLNSYLADGMNYTDGKLVVPIGGVYFIYAQFYHLNGHAMNVNVNNKQRLRIQSPTHPHKHELFAPTEKATWYRMNVNGTELEQIVEALKILYQSGWPRGLGYLKSQEATDLMIDTEGWLHKDPRQENRKRKLSPVYSGRSLLQSCTLQFLKRGIGPNALLSEGSSCDEFESNCALPSGEKARAACRCDEGSNTEGVVSPSELEALLRAHPAIEDAAVVGVSNPQIGELPMAYVVSKNEDELTEMEIMQYVDENVAPHKRLRGGVDFISTIPKAVNVTTISCHSYDIPVKIRENGRKLLPNVSCCFKKKNTVVYLDHLN
ncbi:unnamed protein product [Porites evermanni]|uniref:Uncharacterized protein n=1 Tax=Porites evermanni TaxID=104178 RepID=A0ABN8MEX6_9CNID|nr:unnamed protein product [Porites evermanni]